MSTILDALQKSKLEQQDMQAAATQKIEQQWGWKVALSFALVVIIVLLSALLYLLLNPLKITAHPSTIQPETIPTSSNNLVKVNFETQLLPSKVPQKTTPKEIKQVVIAKEVKVAEPEITKEVEPKKAVANKQNQQAIEYEETSEQLKKRFELALLLMEMEKNDSVTDDTVEKDNLSDGSDIHEMSSNFQNQVPVIRYDSHVYSSIQPDRWIRINGERLTEGNFDSSGQLQLIEIQPQRSIFRFERQSFSLESLTDWKGY